MPRLIEQDGRPAPGGTVTNLVAATGTADGTVADVGGSFNQATLNNNFQDIVTALNALQNALRQAGVVG